MNKELNTMWEHCVLALDNAIPLREKDGFFTKGKMLGWGYDCHITFFRTNGTTEFSNIADINKPLDFNPFNKALSSLSSEGWELVSVQHANLVIAVWGGSGYSPSTERHWNTLSNVNKIAYFKRKIVQP